MALTVLDIISDALGELGVLAAGAVPDAGMAAHALRRLNDLRGRFAVQPETILKETRTEWTITAGTQDYNVGTGQTVNFNRPARNAVQSIAFIDTAIDASLEFSRAEPFSEEEWAAVPDKTMDGTYPSRARYNPTYQYGTITIWPNPTTTTLKGVLYALEALAEFSAITDAVTTMPGALRQVLVKQLALDLAPSYKIDPPQILIQQARTALSAWNASNFRPENMRFPREALISSRCLQPGYDIKLG